MKKLTATFTDGTVVTRKTDREYAVAWLSSWYTKDGRKITKSGFSNNPDKIDVYKPTFYCTARGLTPAQRQSNIQRNEQELIDCRWTYEIAAVTKV